MIGKILPAEAFSNLITNSLEAMKNGGRLNISPDTAGDEIVTKFGDTGSGIPGYDTDKVFEPLPSTKDGSPGPGLFYPARSLKATKAGTMLKISLEKVWFSE